MLVPGIVPFTALAVEAKPQEWILEKIMGYAPVEDVARAKSCAMRFVIAGDVIMPNQAVPPLAVLYARDPRAFGRVDPRAG